MAQPGAPPAAWQGPEIQKNQTTDNRQQTIQKNASHTEFLTLPPVLMLSTYPEKQYAARCIQLGAAGYLHKSADPDLMIAAVRRVAAGERFLSEATAQALAATLSRRPAAGASVAGQGIEALSHREHQVFSRLIQGHGATQIGAELGLAPNTVSTYRARILEKTGARNDVELALLAERHGSGR